MSSHVTEKVKDLAGPFASEAGFEVAEVEYKKEGQDWFLRVFLDSKDKAVDIDACSFVSDRLSKVLDELDPVPNAYFLEVCSRGAERQLKKTSDFSESIGERIFITTYEPIDGSKAFKGTLIGVEDDHIVFEEDGKQIKISLKKVANARLDVGF